MRQSSIIILTVLIVQAYSAPQFITFSEGKLGVNFGGYHAGVGLGGLAGGNGRTGGGLYAEAGTPNGPAARAGLGGAVDGNSGTFGGLFAGATAGGNVNAAAGLGGAVTGGKSVGGGFSTANAGGHGSSSVLVHVEPTPTEVITIRKHKPHRHHLHKTVFIGGYAGAGGEVAAPETKVKETVVYKTVQPIQKRIDIEAHGDAGASVHGEHGHGQDVSYRKEVVVSAQKPSTFFQDIFNIPISTLKAVSGFLTNTAENTGVTVHKSASVQADSDSDSISSKHAPSSSSSASEAHISVQTPSASKLIDGIFSIPINTLSAVNKFLENNVAGRKRVQVSEGPGEPTRVRLGPYARRRAHKQVVIVQEPAEQNPQESN
ncbi:uncharacterized protein LOC110381140 isoform X2 [Helicoverpa armigera]|uniref:uncharacterized protein LOC110381140 isoform X2 n=1 Tax=Helicoverpa armigera TaxID=29058 RepID=UPI0030830669